MTPAEARKNLLDPMYHKIGSNALSAAMRVFESGHNAQLSWRDDKIWKLEQRLRTRHVWTTSVAFIAFGIGVTVGALLVGGG